MATTVAESVTWATHEEDLKAYLDITDTDEDERLERWLTAAAIQADQFIDNELDEPLNDTIVTGCFEWVRLIRDAHERTVGLVSVKTGDLAETYDGGTVTPEKITLAVSDNWWPFKEDIVP